MSEKESNIIVETSRLTRQIAVPVTTEPVHYVVVPADCQIKSLKEFQYPDGLRPEVIRAEVRLVDTNSFIDYVRAFKNDRTRIFAGSDCTTFRAVLDYHGAATPEFARHKAFCSLKKSRCWITWAGKNETSMTQTEFAEFLEDNVSDIFDPAAAAMIDVARDLHAHTECSFGSQVRLSNGQVQLKYSETVTAGVGSGSMEVPEMFTIRIPLFFGGAPTEIKARLRYRINSGKLTFLYKLHRQDEILETAFRAIAREISGALEIPVWFGEPE